MYVYVLWAPQGILEIRITNLEEKNLLIEQLSSNTLLVSMQRFVEEFTGFENAIMSVKVLPEGKSQNFKKMKITERALPVSNFIYNFFLQN